MLDYCADWWGGLPGGEPETDPTGPAAGTMPVCRGGSVLNESSWGPGTRMGYLTSDRGHWAYGFRVVRELPEKRRR